MKNLLNKEMSLIELDNYMESLGYETIFNEVDETTLKMNGSATYDEVNIIFDIVDNKNNIIKITNIEEI